MIEKRRILKWMTFFIILNCFQSEVFAGPKVAVYYGSTVSVKDREKMLKTQLGSEDVIVFARSKDFFQTLDQDAVPVIIAPFLIELNRTDYDPVLQFTVSGSKEFHYRIVTLADKKVDIAKIDTITLGMIEETDRQKLKKFFKDNVGLNLSKINSVPKTEDLFPLLVFNAADAIVVSEDNYAKLVKVFTAKTNDLKVDTHPILYPRVYIKKGQESDLIKKLESLSKENLATLGFDTVERIVK